MVADGAELKHQNVLAVDINGNLTVYVIIKKKKNPA